jgi:hypothetical protein
MSNSIHPDTWQIKQDLAKPGRYYGDGGTIHGTEYVDIETDSAGRVVAVWFRCQMLPFEQTTVHDVRAHYMREAYAEGHVPKLTGVEVLDAE